MAFALAALGLRQRLRPEGPAGPGAAGSGGQRRGDRGLVGPAPVMRLPGAPEVAYRGDSLHLEDLRPRRAGAPLRHAALCLFARRDGARPVGLPAGARRPRPPDLLRVKANSNLAVLQTVRPPGCGFDIVSGGELERVLAAGGDPARDRLLRRRQDPRRDARRRSTPACSASTSRATASSSRSRPSPRGRAARARVSLRVNPDVDAKTHPYISTGLKRQQVRHRPYRGAGRLPPRRAAARHRGGRHRLPHRLADHRERTLRRRARPPARPGRGARGRRHRHSTTSTSAAASASPTTTRRRPMPKT